MSYKHISLVFLSFLIVPLFWSCSKELDVEPQGSSLIPKQVAEAWRSDPSKVSASLSGMYDELKKMDRLERGADAFLHSDYGYPNLANLNEVRTGSMWLRHSTGKSYDFMYAGSFDYKAMTPTSVFTAMPYYSYYAYIKAANDFIASSTADSEAIKQGKGQALAFRAFSYYCLIQEYQFTYLEADNRSKLGVPLILETTSSDDLLQMPRATVQEVYDQIEKDLTEAKELLKNMLSVDGETINLHVVNGLLARLYLSKGEYSAAATAAQDVIDNSGRTPYDLEEASYPHFVDAKDHNVLWGIVWTMNDRAGRDITSWTSMNSPLKGGGYAQIAPRCLNPAIFASINDNDVRKAWWLTTSAVGEYTKGVDLYIEKVLDKNGTDAQKIKAAILDGLGDDFINACIKFAPPDFYNEADFSGDFPLMRIEEMYYILAEAKYRNGDVAGGTTVLEDFVSTYREPGYTLAANGGDFEKEIIRQKQIEFFGEGIPYWDMMRLNLKMVRSDSKAVRDVYPRGSRFDLEPSDVRRLRQFPQKEIQQNLNIKQNPYEKSPVDTF